MGEAEVSGHFLGVVPPIAPIGADGLDFRPSAWGGYLRTSIPPHLNFLVNDGQWLNNLRMA